MDRIPDPTPPTARSSGTGTGSARTSARAAKAASALVADAVAEELREVLAALDLDAAVTVRQDTDPVFVSRGAAEEDDPLRLRKWGPTVVDLPLGDGAVLAQALKGQGQGLGQGEGRARG